MGATSTTAGGIASQGCQPNTCDGQLRPATGRSLHDNMAGCANQLPMCSCTACARPHTKDRACTPESKNITVCNFLHATRTACRAMHQATAGARSARGAASQEKGRNHTTTHNYQPDANPTCGQRHAGTSGPALTPLTATTTLGTGSLNHTLRNPDTF